MGVTLLQVGEGRFLRAFLDVMVDEARSRDAFGGRLVLTAPRPSGARTLERLRAAGGRYTVVVSGPAGRTSSEVAPFDRIVDGYTEWADLLAEVVAPVPLIVVSNVTEAGLAHRPDDHARPTTYPARLARWLDARARAGVAEPVAVIPCELLEGNARILAEAVRRHAAEWGLDAERLLRGVTFAETLVDRIVTPAGDDPLTCSTEPYMAWFIGGAPDWAREALGLDPRHAHWVSDVTPARDRKLRLLNATHTLMAVVGLQTGADTVAGALGDPLLGPFVRAAVFEEAVASFAPGDRPEAVRFAEETWARLANPGIRDPLERLLLALRPKAEARWTPVLEGYRRQRGGWPARYALAMAAYLRLSAEPAAASAVDLTRFDDPAWIGRLREMRRGTPEPADFVRAAARDPEWPLPAAPDLVARIAAHYELASRDGMARAVAASAT